MTATHARFRWIILSALPLLLFGCTTAGRPDRNESEVLDRWLYGETPEVSSEAGFRGEEPKEISLQSLESVSSSSGDRRNLPEPEYFSFSLSAPARIALEAESDAGAEIALIDRASGVISRAGTAGKRDGRIDLTLDAGEYRVETRTKSQEDTAEIRVTEFSARAEDPLILMHSPQGTLHQTALGDYEQISYWIRVEKDTPLILEALGRNLRTVHLWKDGVWIIDQAPGVTEYSPVPGQPMGYTEFYGFLEPGNYLVTFYGGSVREWAEENDENPFYVRFGAKYLGSTLDAETVISPMGRDAFIVSGNATVFQAENIDFIPLRIGLVSSLSRGRFNLQNRADLKKDGESTRVSLSVGTSRDLRWFSVQGIPGDGVRLRVLPSREIYELDEPARDSRYLVSTISGIDSDHAADATALIIRAGDGKTTRDEVVRTFAVEASPEEPLYREINTAGMVTLMVDLDRAGKWGLLHDRDTGEVNVALLSLRDLLEEDNPEFDTVNPAVFDLEAGKHLLMLQPNRPGILKFVLYYADGRYTSSGAGKARQLMDTPAPSPQQDFTFITEKNEITPGSSHLVIMNQRSGPVHALFVEPLPLTLEEPVPLSLDAGEEIRLPVRLHAPGFLSTGYQSLAVDRDGVSLGDDDSVPAGYVNVRIRNTGTTRKTFVLRLDSLVEGGGYEAPEIPLLTDLFPILEEGQRIFSDYKKGESRYFILRVAEPGFYELETTGRLSIRITTRSQVVTSAFQAATNGPGQNALIQEYLRPGEYLVRVETVGSSEGRAGLIFRRLSMADLGVLSENTWYRTSLPGGTGLTGIFAVEKDGVYSFTSLGLYGTSRVRVEDADAWPVLGENLKPGAYRLYSWPQQVWNRRLTRVVREEARPALPEAGPWLLALNESLRRVWMESEGRVPQEFIIRSPAPLPVNLSLQDSMDWWITDPGGVVERRRDEGNSFILSPGEHRILVRSLEENNRSSYTLTLTTEVLADGLPRTINRPPATIPVILGEGGIYEFWSFGSRDIRARLLSSDGERVLAAGDDREGDWNFYLSRYLPAGEYVLDVQESFSGSGTVSLFCSRREEVRTELRSLPLETGITLDRTIVGIPFTTGEADGPVVIDCDSSAVDLSVYREGRLLAEGSRRLVLPLGGSTEYILRLRSGSLEPLDIRLTIAQPECGSLSWDGKAALDIPEGAWECGNPRGLSLRVDPGSTGLWIGERLEASAALPPGGILPAQEERFWVYREGKGEGIGEINPLYLSPDTTEAAVLEEEGLTFALWPLDGGIRILRAESMTGYLWMRDLEAGERKASFDAIRGDSIASSAILGLAGGDERRVALRDGAPVTGGRQIRISLDEFPVTDGVPLPEARNLEIPSRSARRIDTGTETCVSLLLSPGLIAFSDDGTGGRTFAARSENRAVCMEAAGGRIFLVNIGLRPGRARVEPGREIPALSLTPAAPLERQLPERQTVEFGLDPGGGGSDVELWAPNLESAVLWTSSGRRIEARRTGDGRALLPAVSGTVVATAGPGPLLGWITPADGGLPDWLTGGAVSHARDLKPGESVLSSSLQTWTFTLTEKRFVMLSGGGTGITVLTAGDTKGEAFMSVGSGQDREITALLEPGSYRVITRPIAGGAPEMALRFLSLVPIRISEAEKPGERFMEARERAVFEITVNDTTPVGIGVDAEYDAFETRLFDESLQEIGRGIYYFRELEAGRYYLLLENGVYPMRLKPIVLGDSGSRQGVPESVIEQYRGN